MQSLPDLFCAVGGFVPFFEEIGYFRIRKIINELHGYETNTDRLSAIISGCGLH